MKTSHISAGGTSAARAIELEDRRDGQRLLDRVADAVAAQAQQVQQPAAGDVGQPVDVDAGAQQVERRAHVDDGRLEQRVGDARAAQLGRAVVEAEPASCSSARRASV